MKYEYRIGDHYGCKVIIDIFRKNNHLTLKTKCIHCGSIAEIRAHSLMNPVNHSCRCQIQTHKLSKTKIYSVYHNIKYRCYNTNHPQYRNYGGKGIKLCDEWLNSFEVFYDWAIANGYREGLSIDRIDENGDYCPENCQWITLSENTAKANKTYQHRRSNHGRYYAISPGGIYYEFDNAAEFSREHNLNANSMRELANGRKKSYKAWKCGFVNQLYNIQ